MEQVLIKASLQEWKSFIENLKKAQTVILKTKRTAAQTQMLLAALKDFSALKSMIQSAFTEWETMQQEEIPPLERKLDDMQNIVDKMIHSIKQRQQK